MAQRDGVADGWILFEAWCKRNGGTPFRGRDGGAHVCVKGPLPDDTIEPGDDGTVDHDSGGGRKPDRLETERLNLKLKAAKLELEEAQNRYEKVEQMISSALKASRSK